MFKKFLSLFAIIFFIGTQSVLAQEEFNEDFQSRPVERDRIAVIIDTPGGSLAEPEAIYKAARSLMSDILADKNHLYVLPIENVDAYVQIYREEHDIDVPVADAISNSGVKPALKRSNLFELGNFLKSKYIIYMRMTTSAPGHSYGFFHISKRTNVSTDFRIWSQEKRNFIYAKRYQLTGVSRTYVLLGLGNGSSSNAAKHGADKAFSEIRADLETIRAMID